MSRKAELRRKQIIKAAYQAVADKGYETVTLQDIANYADVSKGVPNYYFQNKEDVLAHLLEEITERIYQKEKAAVENETSFQEMLQAYINAVFVNPQDNEKFYKVYLDFLAQATRNERYREINARFYQNCFSISQLIIMRGESEGLLNSKNHDDDGKAMRSLIDGYMIQWLMTGDHQKHRTYKESCLKAIQTYLTS
ncbi:TetR family transcriptional regulator C-terminal domain-containing protein [Alkalihalobacillus macyae]|uniref:TetR/AcrR family transcriptional regulator n=1 Tax=Guptibacillus hwajinpoensis TaxID=208199 RepID=UPI00273A83AB|nr:TetR family transcriptional regulator C-terminal domain-containing protein [Alkalihalobacillus macyae]MDP4553243.1 TetR family transcriptional regulator C-terminal domain-containing protein [Alkalihalobacillus macyae]